MKKTVLYLMEYPIDLPGGGQMSTQTLCEGIAEMYGEEFEPVVCCPELLKKSSSDYPFDIITYRSDENREDNMLRRMLNFVRRIGSFYRIIKKLNPDLIHISMSESLITFGALRCIGIFSKIPFIYTDRGLAYGYRRHSLACIKATLKHAEYMITTTDFNKGLWLKHDLICPVTVIPNTISKVFEDYDENKRQSMRNKYGIKDNQLVIGFAGRISEEKDWDFVPVLVKALADSSKNETGDISKDSSNDIDKDKIKNSSRDSNSKDNCNSTETKLALKIALVISVYEEKDTAIVNDIKGRICDAVGKENLIYMQDLSQSEMADYYYLVDIFVMSSMFESFGKAAVEAMSRKCDVLSTTAGGLPEVISKSENLYTKDNVKKFADRVLYLNGHRDELESDREFFYNRYKDNYTIDVNVSRHVELYKEILKMA